MQRAAIMVTCKITFIIDVYPHLTLLNYYIDSLPSRPSVKRQIRGLTSRQRRISQFVLTKTNLPYIRSNLLRFVLLSAELRNRCDMRRGQGGHHAATTSNYRVGSGDQRERRRPLVRWTHHILTLPLRLGITEASYHDNRATIPTIKHSFRASST